jgi:YggT family protein
VEIICWLLSASILVILAWIILSYVVAFGRLGWDHPVRKLYEFLSRLVEPVLRPIRRIVPPVRLGGAALDLSPLILIVGISVLNGIIC